MYEKIISAPKNHGWILGECKQCHALFFRRNLDDEYCGLEGCRDTAINITAQDEKKNEALPLDNLKEGVLGQLHQNFPDYTIEESPLDIVTDQETKRMVFSGAYVFYDSIRTGHEPESKSYIAIQPIIRALEEGTLLEMSNFSAFMNGAFMNVRTERIDVDAGEHMRVFFVWMDILQRLGLNLDLLKLRYGNEYLDWGSAKTKADVISVLYNDVVIGQAYYAQMPVGSDQMRYLSDISFCLEYLALAINPSSDYVRQMYPMGISVYGDVYDGLRMYDDIRTTMLLLLLNARINKHSMGQELVKRTRRLSYALYGGGFPMLFTAAKFYYKQWLSLTTLYDYASFETLLRRLECLLDSRRKKELAKRLGVSMKPEVNETYREYCRRLVGNGEATAVDIFLAQI